MPTQILSFIVLSDSEGCLKTKEKMLVKSTSGIIDFIQHVVVNWVTIVSTKGDRQFVIQVNSTSQVNYYSVTVICIMVE